MHRIQRLSGVRMDILSMMHVWAHAWRSSCCQPATTLHCTAVPSALHCFLVHLLLCSSPPLLHPRLRFAAAHACGFGSPPPSTHGSSSARPRWVRRRQRLLHRLSTPCSSPPLLSRRPGWCSPYGRSPAAQLQLHLSGGCCTALYCWREC